MKPASTPLATLAALFSISRPTVYRTLLVPLNHNFYFFSNVSRSARSLECSLSAVAIVRSSGF